MIAHNRYSLLKEANHSNTHLSFIKPKLVKQESFHIRKDSKCLTKDTEKDDKENKPANTTEPSSPLKKMPSETMLQTLKDRDLTDIELQNVTSFKEYGQNILSYLKEYEKKFPTDVCLSKHEITSTLRAKMVDWMIEVLTNFKCRDLTLYLAVKIMDRFCKACTTSKKISDLHIIGVASMFIASKYEDIYPLRMQMVYEKIAHKKITIESIKQMEREIMAALGSTLGIPTTFEFIRIYIKYIPPNEFSQFVEQMSFYLAKVCLHDYQFCGYKSALTSASCIYVAFKICEQLNKVTMIDKELVSTLCGLSSQTEAVLMECSQKVLHNAQNFEKQFTGLENLKKTHFVNLANFLNK